MLYCGLWTKPRGSVKVTINLWQKFGTLFEAAKTPRSKRRRYGEEVSLSLSPRHPMGSMGERPKLLQRGPGRSPGRKLILCVLSSTEHISGRQKLLELQRVDVKSGQIRDRIQNSGQFSVPNDLVFFRDRPSKFGTVPKNSGRMVTLFCYSAVCLCVISWRMFYRVGQKSKPT